MATSIKQQILDDLRTAIAVREEGGNAVFGYLGMPGVGKTEMVYQAAAEVNHKVFGELTLSGCFPTDIRGYVPNMEDEVLSALPNDDIPLQYRVGDEAGVWFIDEVTNATGDTLKALQQALISRAFGKHKLGKNIIVILAGNRQADKAGSGVLSSAIYNRVTWRDIEWTASNSDDAVEYIAGKHYKETPEAAEFMGLLRGYFAHKPILAGDFTTALTKIGKEPYVQWCSPRSLESLVRRVKANGWKLPGTIDMAGDIGVGRATELAGFMQLLGKLPKFDVVVKDPAKAKLPEAIDAQYAMVSMLAVRADATNIDKVWEYVMRFAEQTIKITFIRIIRSVTPEVKNTKTYRDIFSGKADPALVEAVLGV